MSLYSIKSRTQSWYGESTGILILDAAYPCIPGNVGNASTFPFPVRYKVVKDASIKRLLTDRDPTLVQPFVDAARQLQDEGVKAVTGACGFMALFQRQVAAALDIPVYLSSLLQLSFIRQIMKPGSRIGLITADRSALQPEHFAAVGADGDLPLVIRGMEDQKEFREAVLEEKGTLDSAAIEAEILRVAGDMMRQHPDIGAFLLECSDLPPYAHAVQQLVQRPVFDFFTMIHYVHTALVRRAFQGFM